MAALTTTVAAMEVAEARTRPRIDVAIAKLLEARQEDALRHDTLI